MKCTVTVATADSESCHNTVADVRKKPTVFQLWTVLNICCSVNDWVTSIMANIVFTPRPRVSAARSLKTGKTRTRAVIVTLQLMTMPVTDLISDTMCDRPTLVFCYLLVSSRVVRACSVRVVINGIILPL